MCAPPLADASLDRRLQNAYKSTRRGEALAHPWRSENFRGSRVWAMCERTRHTTRCQESWLTDKTQTLALSGCFVVLKYKTSLTTLSILLLRGHRWFRIRFTPSVHRRDQLAALHEGILDFDHRVGHFRPLRIRGGVPELPFPQCVRDCSRWHRLLGWSTP